MRLYLAGPMSGIPQHNFPAFDSAAAALRALGYEIVSPSELDDPEERARCLASPDGTGFGKDSWGTLLGRDVALIADSVDGIVFLPRWYESRGARLEAQIGLLCDLQFWQWVDIIGCHELTRRDVALKLYLAA